MAAHGGQWAGHGRRVLRVHRFPLRLAPEACRAARQNRDRTGRAALARNGIRVPRHTDQRPRQHGGTGHRQVQPARRLGEELRRAEQRLRMGAPPFFHNGGQHGVPALHRHAEELLPVLAGQGLRRLPRH